LHVHCHRKANGDTDAHPLTQGRFIVTDADMAEHTPYQKKVIERYYDHRDEIMLARLGEIVTDLFLVETERKRDQLWGRAEHAMKALKVPSATVRQIVERREPELLARSLRQWLADAHKKNAQRSQS
jgi:hypothetical protein